MSKEKSCSTCGFFAELKEPFERSDGAVIYGYCFKDGDKDYSPNMGKGYPVFVDGGGGACKQYKRRRAALREQLTTNCHQLETVTNRNGFNCTESNTDQRSSNTDNALTNADHYRSMTDEELAVEIMCPYHIEPEMCNRTDTCVACCLEWLKQPYREEV